MTGGALTIAPAEARRGGMVKVAAALMSSTVASAGLGFLFWVVAARWFPADVFGRASAAVSSMTLLASIAQLNLVNLYARFLPGAGPRTRSLVLGGYAASAAMAVLLGVGFLAVGAGTDVVGAGAGARVLFVVAVVASANFFITDGVLAALRRASWVPVKNVASAAGKLALLPLLAGVSTGAGLFLSWVVPVAVTTVAAGWWTLTRLTARRRPEPGASTGAPRQVLGFASAEYVNGIVSNAVAFLPPILVTAVLGPVESAYFYIPWIIGVAGTTLLWNVVTSTVVEAAGDRGRFQAHLHRAVRLGLAVVVPGTLVLVAGAEPLLRVLGPEYALHGTTPLRLIGASLPFTAVILLYSAFAIMDARMWRLTAIQSAGVLAFLGGAWWGLPRLGIVAPALALLLTQGVIALALLPRVLARFRPAVTT